MGVTTFLAAFEPEAAVDYLPVVATGIAGAATVIGFVTSVRQGRRDKQQVESLQRSLAADVMDATLSAALAYERLDDQPTRTFIPADEALDDIRTRAEAPPLEEIRSRAGSSYKILTDHYSNALTQSRAYFLLSYIVGIIGFLVMLGGVAIAYNGSLDSGILAALVGAVVDGAAGLVFAQANKAQSNSQENLKHLAETVKDDANRETALHLVSLIDDSDRQNEVLGDLAILAMKSATNRSSDPPPSGGAAELPEGRSTSSSSTDSQLRSFKNRHDPEPTR